MAQRKTCSMPAYCAFVLVLSSVCTIRSCTALQTYHIYSSAACQRLNANIECLTILDILDKTEKYFSSKSTLVFHEGEHILQGKVVSVTNISNFTLQGYVYSGSGRGYPTITCVNSSLLFSDVSITINSIDFNHCSISLSHSAAAVQDSRFENGSAEDGGALAIQHSVVQFDGAISFVRNVAEWYGGAVYVEWSTVTFSGNTVFSDNKAQFGGALYCRKGNNLSIDGISIFMQNTAAGDGGALCASENNTLSFSTNSSFVKNTAGNNGGAVFSDINVLSFSGNSSFTSNTAEVSGGAVYAWTNNTIRFIGSSSFLDNTVILNDRAVYSGDSNTSSFSGNSGFMSNTAERRGGAVFVMESNTLSFNGNSSFVSNTAEIGGAMGMESNNTVNFKGNNNFMANSAKISGAMTVWWGNTLSFSGNSFFANNMAEYGGGVVHAQNSNILSFDGNTIFTSNSAYYGGAVHTYRNNTLKFTGSSAFESNTAEHGGAVHSWYGNTWRFDGDTIFISNLACDGGAVCANYSNTLSFSGSSTFVSNAARFGGAVHILDSNSMTFKGNSSFMNNTANLCGGAVYAKDGNTLTFIRNSSFIMNTADRYGGAMFTSNNNTLCFDGISSFESNTAELDGGAVYTWAVNTLRFNGSTNFINSTAHNDGGAVCAVNRNTLSFDGKSTFVSNTASIGGAVHAVNSSTLIFNGDTTLEFNKALQGGGIALFSSSHLCFLGRVLLSSNIGTFGGGAFIQNSTVESTENIAVVKNKAGNGGGLFVQSSEVKLHGVGLFLENMVINDESSYGGAVFARSSKIEFQGFFDLTNNTAEIGGGLAFFGIYDGVLVLKDGTNLSFEGNLAYNRGGAIYVEDDPFTFCTFHQAMQNNSIQETCFFQTRSGPYDCFQCLDVNSNLHTDSVTLKFDHNIATVSGDNLYGGHLESCVVCSALSVPCHSSGLETFQLLANGSDMNGFSKMASDPYKVCTCEEMQPNCNQRQVNITVYPGQVLMTSVVTVGQMNGVVPSVIRAVSDNLVVTSDFKETQPAENNKQCSQLQYTLFSHMPNASLKLYSDEPCSTSGHPLTFLINFLPCPVGFTLIDQGTCICDERLQKYTQNCNIQNLTIRREGGDSFWVGVEGLDKLVLHPHCPFDYCTDKPAYFPLNTTDVQCASGRSGILCGACQPGLSLALGSSQCLSACSNTFLALLLAFVLAGVALVAFLFLCRLTVAEGTLSGLIFYANVLAVNQTVFFPAGQQNFFTVFIAWLNLDLGIETCFFVGLDAYYSTWLQFAFPIYVWLIVGVIIVLADRSVIFAKAIRRTNPVAVLATLFLLSYTKLFRAIMTACSFTILDYPHGVSKYVWLYDGNVGYLEDTRHIILFLFSIFILFFVFVPYTLLLFCGQWIQRRLTWLSSTKQLYLKAFLDTHYSPYRNKHRYWTGLLLVFRFLMLCIATITNINNPQDPFSNLLVILVMVSSLFIWAWIAGRFYKKWHHDLLEALFLFNLLALVGGTLQIRLSGGNQSALIYTSVSVAILTFIGIVGSAVIRRLNLKLTHQLHTAIIQRFTGINENHIHEDSSLPTTVPMPSVTYSVVEIDQRPSSFAQHEDSKSMH